MLIIGIFVIRFITIVPIVSAVVSPSQLYHMVDDLVDFYMNESCLVMISSGGYTPGSHVAVVHVNPFNKNIEDRDMSSSYKMAIIAPVLELGCNGILVQMEDPGKQVMLVEKTFVHVHQRTRRRFIILPTITRVRKDSMGEEAEILDSRNFDFRSVLREDSILHIPDVIFAVPNHEDDLVDIWTHRFTGPGDCPRQEMLLETYDVAEKRFALSANLFPDKVKDLEGKVLRVAMFHYTPYSVILGDGDQNQLVDGTEWRFVNEFAKLHNCSLEVLIDDDGAWGTIYSNHTGNGVIGNVYEDKADIGITALLAWHFTSLYLDLSAPSYRSGVTCLVPRSHRIPQWMAPVRPFAPTLWATFVGMTILSMFFTGILSLAESYIRSEGKKIRVESLQMSASEAVLTVLKITLLQGLTKDLEGPSSAVLSITLLVVSLLIATAYGSSLASAMTVPRFDRPIDTASELASSGILWGAKHNAWIFAIHEADEPEMRTLVENFRVLRPSELIRNSVESDSFAFPIDRLQAGNYGIENYLSSEAVAKMHLMRTDIYWGYCVAMLRKSSPYTEWFSQRILEIQASGIPEYWEADIARKYMDRRTQFAIEEDDFVGGEPKRITTENVEGTFYILAVGLLISAVVFLGELCTQLKSPGGLFSETTWTTSFKLSNFTASNVEYLNESKNPKL